MHETPSFSLRAQSSGRAEVGLIGQHDKKFCLLAMGSLHDNPRRDFVRNVHRVTSNALLIPRKGPIAPNAAMAAPPKKSTQKTERNRDCVNLLFRFVIQALVRLAGEPLNETTDAST